MIGRIHGMNGSFEGLIIHWDKILITFLENQMAILNRKMLNLKAKLIDKNNKILTNESIKRQNLRMITKNTQMC